MNTAAGSDTDNDTAATPVDDHHSQAGWRVRCEWGPMGLRRLAPFCDVIVVIDVLSFTTSVDMVVGNGGVVLPYRWHDGNEADYAAEQGAMLAAKKKDPDFARKFSLSPASLVEFPADGRIVMPSPNGSALCFGAREAGAETVLAGCLRNAPSVGAAAARGATIGVIPAGERWKITTGSLRPALEDWLGAGAVIDGLVDAGVPVTDLSPEARGARASFRDARTDLLEVLEGCASGRELFELRPGDPPIAALHGVSDVVPTLVGDELRNP